MADLNNNENSKSLFAKDFFPTFSASKLGEFCNGKQSELSKIKFLRQFKPFSDVSSTNQLTSKTGSKKEYKSGERIRTKKAYNSLLDKSEKEILKQTLDESIDTEALTFDDEEVIEAFRQKVDASSNLGFLMSMLKLSATEQQEQDEYQTAESDEELFKKATSLSSAVDYAKNLQVTRYISFMRGRKLENHVLAKINKESEKKFEKNKAKKTIEFERFRLVGIIDGISADGKRVLEIKTRSKLSMEKSTITSKEKKQALTYMKMHGCQSCLFVEVGPDGNTKKTEIEWDEEEFEREIMSKLDEFCMFARGLSEEAFRDLLEQNQL